MAVNVPLGPLLDPAFHLGSVPTTWAELLGFATGAVNVWMVVRQNILNWPVGIANVVLLGLVFLDGGLPQPLLQWPIRDPQLGREFRIDLGWPTKLVGVEADGTSVHGSPRAIYQDRHRQNRLAALLPGLTLFRFTWADTYTPDTILIPLRQALQLP